LNFVLCALFFVCKAQSGFARKVHFAPFASALPLDVRRGYAAPFNLELILGFALGSPWAIKIGQSPNRGHSPFAD
jgi:hypothetical protein